MNAWVGERNATKKKKRTSKVTDKDVAESGTEPTTSEQAKPDLDET